MANYVVDASIVIEYLITGTYTPNVQAFFNQVTANDHLVVPEFCLLECTNKVCRSFQLHISHELLDCTNPL